ncbi:MAG TPA: nucleoside 2-deoxyribosyltransferase [Gemmataceae bacterium]|jgi:nucleoside 2-deoxyribosyltransferase
MSDRPLSERPTRVYLAGPDVFLRDAVGQGERKKALCRQYGLEGVFPFDVEVESSKGHARETALLISKSNEELIRGCRAMIANMTPFRGPSADVGTAYEMGMGRALGLLVFAYTNVAVPFTTRTASFLGPAARRDQAGCLRDGDDMAVEEWGLMDNLMLEGGALASGGELVVVNASERERFNDLSGFEKCVQGAARALLGACSSASPTRN